MAAKAKMHIKRFTSVGLPSTLVWAGVTQVDPQSNLVAIAAIGCAAGLACAVILASRALAYAATIAWAIGGVIVASVVRDDRPEVAAFAAVAGLAVLGVTVFTLLQRDGRARGR